MSKTVSWVGTPPPPTRRLDTARSAWMAAVEHLKPELFATNDKIDEVNQLYKAFEDWWKHQIDQCFCVIARRGAPAEYLACLLHEDHEGDHQVHDSCEGDEQPDAAWVTPAQLAWRQRRS